MPTRPDLKRIGRELPEGFRLIGEADGSRAFESGDMLMDRFSLRDYVSWARSPDSLVVVREAGGGIAGVVHVIVGPGHVTVDKLVRNTRAARGVGTELLRIVELVVASFFRVKEVRLDALGRDPRLRQWYRANGYEDAGEPVNDPEWGLLFPMRKRLG